MPPTLELCDFYQYSNCNRHFGMDFKLKIQGDRTEFQSLSNGLSIFMAALHKSYHDREKNADRKLTKILVVV